MTVRQRIRAFILENFYVDAFGDDDSFLESGIVDSMGMLQLVAFVEETFGFRIADDELVPENLDSVSRAAAFVDRKAKRHVA
jgi:acyl carrier protein